MRTQEPVDGFPTGKPAAVVEQDVLAAGTENTPAGQNNQRKIHGTISR
jgi:hypothetical protein